MIKQQIVSLFTNRSWLRSRKDHIYHVILIQFRYLVDHQILSLDWSALELNAEDDHRQYERSKAMDKLEDQTVYLNIAFDSSSSCLKIIMSDRKIAADVDIDEYGFEVVSDQRIISVL